jgi:hypothetical protein
MKKCLIGAVTSALLVTSLLAAQNDAIPAALRAKQYDLADAGQSFLLKEAAAASFFMLGELHGDDQTPTLIRALWPAMWKMNYRHIAAELSPWSANRLEFPPRNAANPIDQAFSWSRADVRFVAAERSGQNAVLWGSDIEEERPHFLIRDLAAANPANSELQAAVKLTESGYQRSAAPALLQHVLKATTVTDSSPGGVSLRDSIIRTLEIEMDRSNPASRLRASTRREILMKDLFHRYWQKNGKPKVMLRFGRNHLHRGLDRRGVSTLGNFVAELAAANGLKAFNVAEFSGGGKISMGGQLVEFGELDDPAVALLASSARYPATLFDLRPIRQALHQIADSRRSPAEASLLYWADSYDAVIFYREVTPVRR